MSVDWLRFDTYLAEGETAWTTGDLAAAAHALRNAGAILAQFELEGAEERASMFADPCPTCGHRPVVAAAGRDRKQWSRDVRRRFRLARERWGIDAVANPTPSRAADGTLVGYGTTERQTDPNVRTDRR